MVFYKDINYVGTERRDTTCRIPAMRGGILHVVSRCYVLNQLGNANVRSLQHLKSLNSVPAVLSFEIFNAVESTVALSNYYVLATNYIILSSLVHYEHASQHTHTHTHTKQQQQHAGSISTSLIPAYKDVENLQTAALFSPFKSVEVRNTMSRKLEF